MCVAVQLMRLIFRRWTSCGTTFAATAATTRCWCRPTPGTRAEIGRLTSCAKSVSFLFPLSPFSLPGGRSAQEAWLLAGRTMPWRSVMLLKQAVLECHRPLHWKLQMVLEVENLALKQMLQSMGGKAGSFEWRCAHPCTRHRQEVIADCQPAPGRSCGRAGRATL